VSFSKNKKKIMTESGITEHIIRQRVNAAYNHFVIVDLEIKTVGDAYDIAESALEPDRYEGIVEAMERRRDMAKKSRWVCSVFWLLLLLGMLACAVYEWRLPGNDFVTTVLCLYGCFYCARHWTKAIDGLWTIDRDFSHLKSRILSYHAQRSNENHQD
jgi:hypothetical protein